MATLLVVAVGCLLVVLGLALHKNPQWLLPNYWPLATAKKTDFAKFMAITFVFVGVSSVLFQLAARLVDGLAQVLVLPTSFLLTWICFRARHQQDSSARLNPKK